MIQYNKNDDNYYYYNGHSQRCLDIKKQIYENIAEINREIKKYQDFKDLLINKLNGDLHITYTKFKIWASNEYRLKEYNFEIKTSTIKKIYYTWKNNSLIFKNIQCLKIIKQLIIKYF